MSKILTRTFLVLLFFAVFFFFFAPDSQFFYSTPVVGQVFENNLIVDHDIEIPMTDSDIFSLEEDVEKLTPVFVRIDTLLWSLIIEEQLLESLRAEGISTRHINGILGQLSNYYNAGVFSLDHIRSKYDGTDIVLLTDKGPSDIDLYSLNEISEVQTAFSQWLAPHNIGDENVDALALYLLPNISLDDSARAVRLDNNLSALSYIDTVIVAGDTLIHAGKPISENTIRYLTHLAPQGMGFFLSLGVISILLFLLFIVLIVFIYIKTFMPDVWKFTNQLLLLCAVWLLSLAATGLVWNLSIKAGIYLYATMVSFGAAFTCIFFKRRDGMFFSSVFALALGITHPHPFLLVVITAAAGFFVCVITWDITKRSTIPKGAAVSACGSIAAFLLIRFSLVPFTDIPIDSTVVSLIGASIIGLGAVSVLLPVFEKVFGMYTVLSFVDILKADHKLLLALSEKAPGTWNHSQLVSELAKQAALVINADDTLASAGGLFHDIGKISTPEYFIENQSSDDSPHDCLSPEESARKIISHVRNGVSLAEKAKLPRRLIEIIRQHHGTGTTLYFYNKALESAVDPADVNRTLYQYGGPKPDSLESAIVLLADQAASATKNTIEKENIRDTVASVINNIDAEGQLDDCQLTRKNLKEIEEVFSNILEGKIYKRIDHYPEGDKSVAD